jgi:hypothetical protein
VHPKPPIATLYAAEQDRCQGVPLVHPAVAVEADQGLGLAVAAGGHAFDSIPVDGGPVLYLALEDTPRRLQTRMGKILGDQPAPHGLTLATACPLMGHGGDEAIADWIDRHRDARMVVIDVFAKIPCSARRTRRGGPALVEQGDAAGILRM